MKTIRFFHRRFNYTAATHALSKCRKSLRHSLRLGSELSPSKQFEWNPALYDKAVIWQSGVTTPLFFFDDKTKQDMLNHIVAEPSIPLLTRSQTRLRQYRKKMRTAINSERRSGHEAAAMFLENILEKGNLTDAKSVLKKFEKLAMSRRNQRINMLKTYLEVLEHLADAPPNRNITRLQEGIIKVPHQWNVSNRVITLDEYIEATLGFLKHYFPNYQIKAVFGHDDERDVNEETGAHTHYFLAGRNSETGEYDLLKTQRAVVNDYIRQTGMNLDLFSLDGNLSSSQTKVFGEAFQTMVRGYFNKNLFHPKGLTAELAPETERRSKQRAKMNLQAKLPKEQRECNHHNRMISKQRELLEGLTQESEQVKAELSERQFQLEMIKGEQLMLEDELEYLEQERTTLLNSKSILRDEVAQMLVDRERLTDILHKLTDQVVGRLTKFSQSLFMTIHANDLGLQKKVEVYINKTIEHLVTLPEPFRARGEGLCEEVKRNVAQKRQDTLDKPY